MNSAPGHAIPKTATGQDSVFIYLTFLFGTYLVHIHIDIFPSNSATYDENISLHLVIAK